MHLRLQHFSQWALICGVISLVPSSHYRFAQMNLSSMTSSSGSTTTSGQTNFDIEDSKGIFVDLPLINHLNLTINDGIYKKMKKMAETLSAMDYEEERIRRVSYWKSSISTRGITEKGPRSFTVVHWLEGARRFPYVPRSAVGLS
ncbi:unnamed protein product, partial [Mesorhabditis belari]|uniref:Uncharacterized protein n=1 Tax=Mesorhabditis belari TaxID=2138241 RepID=A0AAF3EDG8_9BILA